MTIKETDPVSWDFFLFASSSSQKNIQLSKMWIPTGTTKLYSSTTMESRHPPPKWESDQHHSGDFWNGLDGWWEICQEPAISISLPTTPLRIQQDLNTQTQLARPASLIHLLEALDDVKDDEWKKEWNKRCQLSMTASYPRDREEGSMLVLLCFVVLNW